MHVRLHAWLVALSYRFVCSVRSQLRRKVAKDAAKDPKVQKAQKILDIIEKPAPVY